jgi:YfiH family protein
MLGQQSDLLRAVPGISHRFFGRVGGTSPRPWRGLNISFDVGDAPPRVEENLARVRFQIGVKRERLFSATQVHGADVIEVTEAADPDVMAAQKADGLWTRQHELGVGVRTADCVPILLAFEDARAVAAVHAGWRGAVGGVVASAVSALCANNQGDPGALVAAVGPCIGPDSFEVGPEVIEAASKVANVDSLVRAGQGDRSFLDLGGLVGQLLEKAGVTRWERVPGDTAVELDRYFSHRAESGRTGRQIAAIAITAEPDLPDSPES